MNRKYIVSTNIFYAFILLLANFTSTTAIAANLIPVTAVSSPSPESSSETQGLLSIAANSANYAPAYRELPAGAKQAIYASAIRDVLTQINADENLDWKYRSAAHQALTGIRMLRQIDIYGYAGSNIFLLSDGGTKTGLVVLLNSSENRPYLTINGEQDLRHLATDEFKANFSSYNRKDGVTYSGVDSALEGFKNPGYSGWTIQYFNYNNPSLINIQTLADKLVQQLASDAGSESNVDNSFEQKLLYILPRSVRGAALPPLGVSVTEVPFRLKIVFGEASASAILKSFATPFSSLAKQTRLLIDGIAVSTLQEVEENQLEAAYIGGWIDVTVGAVTTFSGAGGALSLSQGVSLLVGNALDGTENNPLDIVSVVLELVPGGKIVGKVKKFSETGARLVKGGLFATRKGITIVNTSIKIKEDIESGNYQLLFKHVAGLATALGTSAVRGKKEIVQYLERKNAGYTEHPSVIELTGYTSIPE